MRRKVDGSYLSHWATCSEFELKILFNSFEIIDEVNYWTPFTNKASWFVIAFLITTTEPEIYKITFVFIKMYTADIH